MFSGTKNDIHTEKSHLAREVQKLREIPIPQKTGP